MVAVDGMMRIAGDKAVAGQLTAGLGQLLAGSDQLISGWKQLISG